MGDSRAHGKGEYGVNPKPTNHNFQRGNVTVSDSRISNSVDSAIDVAGASVTHITMDGLTDEFSENGRHIATSLEIVGNFLELFEPEIEWVGEAPEGATFGYL